MLHDILCKSAPLKKIEVLRNKCLAITIHLDTRLFQHDKNLPVLLVLKPIVALHALSAIVVETDRHRGYPLHKWRV